MLRKVEQALQAAIEKPFSRLFPQKLQPAELKARLREALEGARKATPDGAYAANQYTVELNLEDYREIEAVGPALEHELTQYLHECADDARVVIGPYAGVTVTADVRAASRIVRAASSRETSRLEAARTIREGLAAGSRSYDRQTVPAGELRVRAEFAERPPAYLQAEAGFPQRDRQVPLNEQNVIGRSNDCDVVIGDEAVSRRHCEIIWHYVQYLVRDLESANGTFVNGQQVRSAPLREGDLLEVGLVQLRFHDA